MRWLPFFNLALVILTAVVSLGIVITVSQPPQPIELVTANTEKQLPKRSFQNVDLSLLHEGAFALKWIEPTLQLPNLTQSIKYHGFIQRPDVKQPRFHISLIGSDDLYAVGNKEPFYLVYKQEALEPVSLEGPVWSQPETHVGYYPTQEPTSLWLEMQPKHGGKLLEVVVHMIDENGQELLQPTKHLCFTLPLQDPPPGRTPHWDIDDFRVDSTLLIRQKARWCGQDRFLQQHGGSDFGFASERERIDFHLGSEQSYSCFIKAGDYLVWHQGRWHAGYAFSGPTAKLPLLYVKKIDDKTIAWELWDTEGITKIPINLMKTRDVGGMPDLLQEFRFIGAKTWAQFIVESHSGRLLLRAHDWLVLTSEGWVKLDSSQKIDDFVEQKLVGPLLVLDKLSKQNGRQVLVGHLFNSTRSEVTPVEITAALSAYANQYAPNASPASEPVVHGGGE